MLDWAGALRRKNLRVTPQRLVILQTMEFLEQQEEHRHLTAREVCDGVQKTNLGLNDTTIYRALENLYESGLVDVMALGKSVRFSLRRSERAHGHLICRTCNRSQTVSLELFDQLKQQLSSQHGFELEANHLTLRGQCLKCEPPKSIQSTSNPQ